MYRWRKLCLWLTWDDDDKRRLLVSWSNTTRTYFTIQTFDSKLVIPTASSLVAQRLSCCAFNPPLCSCSLVWITCSLSSYVLLLAWDMPKKDRACFCISWTEYEIKRWSVGEVIKNLWTIARSLARSSIWWWWYDLLLLAGKTIPYDQNGYKTQINCLDNNAKERIPLLISFFYIRNQCMSCRVSCFFFLV